MEFYGRTADLSRRQADLLACPEVVPVDDIPIDDLVQNKREQEALVPNMSHGPLSLLASAPLAVSSIRAAWRRHRAEKLQTQINLHKYQTRKH